MSEIMKFRRPTDLTQVNVDVDWDLKYWSDRFAVSHDQLRRVVEMVGRDVDAVRTRLRHR